MRLLYIYIYVCMLICMLLHVSQKDGDTQQLQQRYQQRYLEYLEYRGCGYWRFTAHIESVSICVEDIVGVGGVARGWGVGEWKQTF